MAERCQKTPSSADKHHVGVTLKESDLELESVRKHKIVRIHAREPFRWITFDGVLQSTLTAHWTKLKDADSRISKGSDDLQRPVIRTVLKYPEFEVPVRLVQNARNGGMDKLLAVTYG